MRHLKAAAILALYAWMLLQGTPGLDFMKPGDLDAPREKAELRDQIGDLGAGLAIALADFNRTSRIPLANALASPQRPFRIAQSWSLYRDGPNRVRRLEVRVDGELVHRSADPELDWLAPQLRSRRVRPVAESMVGKRDSPNWRGLARLIVERARADFPEASRVELLAVEGRFPGRKLEAKHRVVATAPKWEPELK